MEFHQKKETTMQNDISFDPVLNRLVQELDERLYHLARDGRLRHGLAAMALAMHKAMTLRENHDKVAYAGDIEVLMRGVYSALAGDGTKNRHVIQKLSLGYCGLMCSYHKGDGLEIVTAFNAFRETLEKTDRSVEPAAKDVPAQDGASSDTDPPIWGPHSV